MVIEPEFSRLIPLSEIGVGAVERQIRANTEELAALAKRFELPSIEKLEAKLAVRRDGLASDRYARFKRAGRDLVMSVQPKGAPMLRKKGKK